MYILSFERNLQSWLFSALAPNDGLRAIFWRIFWWWRSWLAAIRYGLNKTTYVGRTLYCRCPWLRIIACKRSTAEWPFTWYWLYFDESESCSCKPNTSQQYIVWPNLGTYWYCAEAADTCIHKDAPAHPTNGALISNQARRLNGEHNRPYYQ